MARVINTSSWQERFVHSIIIFVITTTTNNYYE
jgi:hypothetical protein